MAKYSRITSKLLAANEHKFWKSVDRTVDGCWLWPKSLDKDGYGRFEFGTNGKMYRIGAHRAAYFFTTGHLPSDNELVCHHCDNPTCVNPGHLFTGDLQANMDDMNNKDRGRSKLKKADVIQIRRLLQSDAKITYDEIAKRFGVRSPTICSIANYASWPKLDVGPIPKRSKINNDDSIKIVEMHQAGISARKIGLKFGVCHHTIVAIIRNRSLSDGESDS